jgi:hypothetical protein
MLKNSILYFATVAGTLHGFVLLPGVSAANNQAQLQTQSSLTPHSVMIESSLRSTLDQVNGIRTQLSASTPATSHEAVEHLNTYKKEIGNDLERANVHLGHLEKSAKKFPNLSQSEEYKDLTTALSEVNRINQDLQNKMASETYWANKEQVQKDMSQFKKQLNQAIDKTDRFVSTKLDIKPSFT